MVRQGKILLNGGTHAVTGELVVGGQFTTANGAAGYDATLQIDQGALTVSSWLSVGRGNGIGGGFLQPDLEQRSDRYSGEFQRRLQWR